MRVSSIVKIVGLVAFLTVIVLILADRLIDNGIVSRIYKAATSEPGTGGAKAAMRADVLGRPHIKKKVTSVTAPMVSMTVGEWSLVPVSPDGGREVKWGMNRSQLLGLLGDPTLRTTETHERKLVERYIYVDRDRHTITVAVLENGRIGRSESGPYVGFGPIQPER
jgi:hypothetical protein